MDEFRLYNQVHYKIVELKNQNETNIKLVNKYFETEQMEDLQNYNKGIDLFEAKLQEVESVLNSLSSYFLLKSIKDGIDKFYEECNAAIIFQRNGNSDYYIHKNEADKVQGYIISYLNQLQETSLEESKVVYIQINDAAIEIRNLVIIAIIIICFYAISFTLFFSHYITKYLNDVIYLAGKIATGDLEGKGKISHSNDEVGTLTRSFDKMSLKMKNLLDEIKLKSQIEAELHKKEVQNIQMDVLLKDAKFQALHSQINPHFLFNTLNTISRTAMNEKAPETRNLIIALSKLLRYNLDNHTEYITIKKEIENLKEYIKIQSIRFKDRIEVVLFSEIDDITDKYIPPFTIQPIVENAIIHGLEPLIKGGKVSIEISEDNLFVYIVVKDNGVGIEQKNIDEIINNKIDNQTHKSIGINNVFERLKRFTQIGDCLEITSILSVETKVTIKLPKKQQKFV